MCSMHCVTYFCNHYEIASTTADATNLDFIGSIHNSGEHELDGTKTRCWQKVGSNLRHTYIPWMYTNRVDHE